MTTTAKKPRAKTLKGGSVVIARESLDHILRPYPEFGLPVSEEFERKVWFVRLIDAGWSFQVKELVSIRRPNRPDFHVIHAGDCDCLSWLFRGKCDHNRAYVALGRTAGIAKLCEWFENREPIK